MWQAFGLLDEAGKKKPTRGRNAPKVRHWVVCVGVCAYVRACETGLRF